MNTKPRRDYTPHKAEAIFMLELGASVGSLSRELSVPEHVIAKWRDDAGIAPAKAGKAKKLFTTPQK
jgi:transposase-like protein